LELQLGSIRNLHAREGLLELARVLVRLGEPRLGGSHGAVCLAQLRLEPLRLGVRCGRVVGASRKLGQELLCLLEALLAPSSLQLRQFSIFCGSHLRLHSLSLGGCQLVAKRLRLRPLRLRLRLRCAEVVAQRVRAAPGLVRLRRTRLQLAPGLVRLALRVGQLLLGGSNLLVAPLLLELQLGSIRNLHAREGLLELARVLVRLGEPRLGGSHGAVCLAQLRLEPLRLSVRCGRVVGANRELGQELLARLGSLQNLRLCLCALGHEVLAQRVRLQQPRLCLREALLAPSSLQPHRRELFVQLRVVRGRGDADRAAAAAAAAAVRREEKAAGAERGDDDPSQWQRNEGVLDREEVREVEPHGVGQTEIRVLARQATEPVLSKLEDGRYIARHPLRRLADLAHHPLRRLADLAHHQLAKRNRRSRRSRRRRRRRHAERNRRRRQRSRRRRRQPARRRGGADDVATFRRQVGGQRAGELTPFGGRVPAGEHAHQEVLRHPRWDGAREAVPLEPELLEAELCDRRRDGARDAAAWAAQLASQVELLEGARVAEGGGERALELGHLGVEAVQAAQVAEELRRERAGDGGPDNRDRRQHRPRREEAGRERAGELVEPFEVELLQKAEPAELRRDGASQADDRGAVEACDAAGNVALDPFPLAARHARLQPAPARRHPGRDPSLAAARVGVWLPPERPASRPVEGAEGVLAPRWGRGHRPLWRSRCGGSVGGGRRRRRRRRQKRRRRRRQKRRWRWRRRRRRRTAGIGRPLEDKAVLKRAHGGVAVATGRALARGRTAVVAGARAL